MFWDIHPGESSVKAGRTDQTCKEKIFFWTFWFRSNFKMSKKGGGADGQCFNQNETIEYERQGCILIQENEIIFFGRIELLSLGEKNGKKNEEADGDNGSKDESWLQAVQQGAPLHLLAWLLKMIGHLKNSSNSAFKLSEKWITLLLVY